MKKFATERQHSFNSKQYCFNPFCHSKTQLNKYGILLEIFERDSRVITIDANCFKRLNLFLKEEYEKLEISSV